MTTTRRTEAGSPHERLPRAIVDGHAHVWSLETDTYPWQPTFGFVPTEAAPPDALLAAMDRFWIDHTLLVQPSAYGPDHRFLLDTVHEHPDRFSPIGLIDPADPRSAEWANSLVDESGCVGLRVNLALDLERATVQARASSWPELEALGVPVCLRATPAHHRLVLDILGRCSHLPIVVDHLGLPEPGSTADAARRLTELARFAQCRLKIAGFARISADAPPYRQSWSLVGHALQEFGASRLLWGSDFPHPDSEAGYAASVAAMVSIPSMTREQRDRIMGGTSRELWRLPAEAAVR